MLINLNPYKLLENELKTRHGANTGVKQYKLRRSNKKMRKPNIYLTKRIRRNIELKERQEKYGYRSLKCISKEQKEDNKEIKRQAYKNAKIKNKMLARQLKAQKRAEKKQAKQKKQENGGK